MVCNLLFIVGILMSGRKTPFNISQLAAVGFWLWLVASKLISKYKINAINSYFVLGYIICTFIGIIWYLDCEDKVVALLNAVIIGELAQSVLLISYVGIENVFSQRMETDIINANNAGIGFGSAALIAILLMQRSKDMAYGALSAFFIMMLFLSGSRTALMSFAVAVVIFFRNKSTVFSGAKIRNIMIAFLVLLIGGFLIFNVDSLYEIIGVRMVRAIMMVIKRRVDRRDGSIYTRFQLYVYGLRMIAKKPVLGYGWDQYRYYIKHAGVIRGAFKGKYIYSHSNVIELLFNMGIVGFVLFYTPLANALAKVYKAKKSGCQDYWTAFVMAMVAKFAMESLFAVFINDILSWILMGVCCAIASIKALETTRQVS